MESFLKYLRVGGGAVAGNQRAPVVATTIAASAACEDGGGDVDDDASFFDLEFADPGEDESDAEEERVEFNFDVASAGAEVVAVGDDDAVAPKSVESGTRKDGAGDQLEEEEVAPPPPATATATASSGLRPATKFRVLLLKLRKPSNKVPPVVQQALDGNNGTAAANKTNRFLIKFRVDEAAAAAPHQLVSVCTPDNNNNSSSRSSGADSRPPAAVVQTAAQAQAAEERRFAKEVVLKYLNKIKPLYVKVSRLRFGSDEGEGEEEPTDAAEPDPSLSSSLSQQQQQEQPAVPCSSAQQHQQPVVVACGVRAPRASVPAGLKQACKRLGKSRSASSAVAAAPSPPPVTAGAAQVGVPPPQRRDDSLLQLQDGIQSAIAHCKRSFNASKGCESPLLRSMTVGADATRDGRAAGDSDAGSEY